jgi:hypothetical protein
LKRVSLAFYFKPAERTVYDSQINTSVPLTQTQLVNKQRLAVAPVVSVL